MRNKKYRPYKLWLILIGVLLIAFPVAIFMDEGRLRITMILCLAILVVFTPLCFTYKFEIKNDRVLIRHALSSFNKQYRSSFKTRTIFINEMRTIYIDDISINKFKVNDIRVRIVLTNGTEISFPISGYFNHREIRALIADVQKQINECSEENSLH